jgi:NitT/TauT family transport system permease protein
MRDERPGGHRLLRALAAAVFWLLVWQLLAVLIGRAVVLSPPTAVIRTLIALMGTWAFWLTLGASFLRILTGYLIGVLLGLLLALLTRWSRIARCLLSPFMSVLKATPVASFIILLLFMTGNQEIPVIIAAVIVLPVVWANVTKGLEETDRDLLEMGRVFGLSRRWQIRRIYGPSVKAYFLPAAATALGLAWKAGVAAEVLAAPDHSVGGMLYRTKLYLENPEMLAWTLCVILISMGLERLLAGWLRRMD